MKLLLGIALLVACHRDEQQRLPTDAPIRGPCDPGTDVCDEGWKCGWVVDRIDPPAGHSECVPAGQVAIGEQCLIGIAGLGYSNCARGSECLDGLCKEVCDLAHGPPCVSANTACAFHRDVFLGENFMWDAGVCEPKCEPLTQARWDGAPACGSPDPAQPSVGCYRMHQDWVCSAVSQAASTRIDGVPTETPYGSAIFNGCAPGFIPEFFEANGVSQVICSGLCAPLPTDNQSPQNAIGDPTVAVKLPSSATPVIGDGVCVIGKKGSAAAAVGQNCLFLGGQPNVGACYDYRKFTGEDHLPVKSCADMTPAEASKWMCVPW